MAQETWIQSHITSSLDTSLLNTQHYKVHIKSEVEQSREGVAPSLTLKMVFYISLLNTQQYKVRIKGKVE